ncbi:MAG: protein kinase [Actinomycetota bacterium]
MAAPLTEPSLLGVLLASRYEIRALLGRGGMGEVFEAVDRRLHRTVAVKVLRPELAADARFLARFRREATTAAGLAHPGIVAVHDVGEDGGRTFIVMEFVAGRTLGELSAGPALDVATVARIGEAVARALAHAHDRGVVHRDISPANVMMTADGAVKVLDFGIARDGGPLGPDAGATHGTLAYLAPEVIRGGPVDARADLFALGAVLAELAWRAGAPSPELDAVLARATATRPEDRFVSASAMAEALDRRVDRGPARSALAPSDLPGDGIRTAPIPRIATRPLPVVGSTPAGLQPVRGISVPRARRRRRGTLARAVLGTAIVGVAIGGAVMLGQSFVSMSEPQAATSVVGPPPVPSPDELAATASCDGLFSTGVDLTWTGAAPVKGYEIWRSGGSDGRMLVARLRGVHTSEFRDTDLGVDASYAYRIRAFDGPRMSEWSNRVEVATPFLCLA